MKKWIVGLSMFVVLALAALYFLIPSTMQLTATARIHAPVNGILRQLGRQQEWAQWWPGPVTDSTLALGDNHFRIVDQQYNTLVIGISSGTDTAYSKLRNIHDRPDTLEMNWLAAVNTSANPWMRFRRYRAAKQIESSMQQVLDSLKAFYEVPSNLYALEIRDEALFDSVLVFTEVESASKPDNRIVYDMVDKLRTFIAAAGAQERNDPMMSYFRTPEGPYSIRVAIPVDRVLKGSDDIVQKGMPPRVRIFTADIHGDQTAADSGMVRMDMYVKDHFLNAAGGPYFILKTDRRQEADSTKWVTRIVYPVM